MSRAFTLKSLLYFCGVALGLAGVVFVGLRLRTYISELDQASIGADGLCMIGGLALVYGTSNTLLARGWWRLLRHLSVDASWPWALKIFALTQLAKYVPGNIFQFAGRQAAGVAAGIGNAPLAKSTVFELAILAVGGALFSLICAPLALRWLGAEAFQDLSPASGVAVFCTLSALALIVLRSWFGMHLVRSAFSYMIFLVISGIVFLGCFSVAGGAVTPTSAFLVVGAYVIAWLAGLLTPGAPAGLGIREAALLLMLASLAEPQVILLAALIGRIVTVFGDTGFWIFGLLVRVKPPLQPATQAILVEQ